MPPRDPEFADIYGVAAVVVRDAHRARRRCAVVISRADHVVVLGRTTKLKDYRPADCLHSAPEPSCKLDKAGMYSTRFQHSIPRKHFDDEHHCSYYGTLPEKPADELLDFWERLLGLR